MIVRWTETAIGHLTAIHDYIAQDSPIYARRMVDRLTRRSQQIEAFPLSGRVVPEYGAESVREIIERPYRIICRVPPERVDVVAIIHGARRLPELPP